MVEDLRFREHSARVHHQVAQELELGRGELDCDAGSFHFVGVFVQFDVSESDDRIGLFYVLGAAQHRADAGHHFFQAEGLGYVVVAAHGQSGDFVCGVVFGGEEHDGGADATFAEPTGDCKAVEVRQHDVEYHEVRFHVGHEFDCVDAIFC